MPSYQNLRGDEMNRAPELKIESQVIVIIRFAVCVRRQNRKFLELRSGAGAGRFRPTSVPLVPSYTGEARLGMAQSDRGQRSGVEGRIEEGANPDSRQVERSPDR